MKKFLMYVSVRMYT